jgi:cohesin complex subunit SA-1/2
MSAAVSSPAVADISSSAPRRKSGRVSKKPAPFVPASSPAGSAKRKRDERDDEQDEDAEMQDISSEEEEESSEGEPDEEELKERRKKNKRKAAARKPAPKKPKTNGEPVSLAIRPATKKAPKKQRKAPIRKSAVAEDTEGIYG